MDLDELRAAYQEADKMFSDLVPSTTEQIAAKLIVALEAELAHRGRMLRLVMQEEIHSGPVPSEDCKACSDYLDYLAARAKEANDG